MKYLGERLFWSWVVLSLMFPTMAYFAFTADLLVFTKAIAVCGLVFWVGWLIRAFRARREQKETWYADIARLDNELRQWP
jgi:uncharacterized membrane protein HdeD (DUF308 family)